MTFPFPALLPVPGRSVQWESGCFHWQNEGWVLFRSLSLPLCFPQELTFFLLVPENLLYGPESLWGGLGQAHPFTIVHLNVLLSEEIHGAHEEDPSHNPVHYVQRGEVHRCLQQGELQMPQSQRLEGHNLQSHLPGGCRSLFVAPEAPSGPEALLGLGENMQGGDHYQSAKVLADWLLVDHVAIPATGGSWDWSGWEIPLPCPQNTLHSHCLPGVFAIPRRVTGACG